ncbi:MAG TPA: hypothetical protein VGK79_09865 [Gaiellaceae bacterium]
MRNPSPTCSRKAARDDHLAAFRERGERQQQRGRVVVDDERRLRAGQPAQQRGGVILPGAAGAAGEVELEIGVAACGLDDLRERLLGERRPAQVRVHEHARRVEHAPERRGTCREQCGL